MKRYCKTLELRDDPELIAAYKKTHAAVWPEVLQGMHEVGIVDMEIYIAGTTLFMIMETHADFDHDMAMQALAQKPRQKEWEQLMSRFQDTSSTATAKEKWLVMDCLFSMKRQLIVTNNE